MDMFDGPIRGGTRGGAAEFKWSDVSADKDRENYLGHSINAPTGRWQKNKDIHWYNRDQAQSELDRLEEIRRIKEAEADILAIQLGFKPPPKEFSNVPVTAIPLPESSSASAAILPPTSEEQSEEQRLAREEKARRKEEKRARKEEKRERKEQRRAEKERRRRHTRSRSRSRSPGRSHRDRERRRSRSRDRSPAGRDRSRSPVRLRRDDRTPPYRRPSHSRDEPYDAAAMERDASRNRKIWEENERRERPSDSRRGR